jgi:hypothetical protein
MTIGAVSEKGVLTGFVEVDIPFGSYAEAPNRVLFPARQPCGESSFVLLG